MKATKRCSECGVVKGLGEFHRWSHSLDGRACRCRLCDTSRRRERRADPTYRERVNARQRERERKRRASDPEYREHVNAQKRERHSDPDTRIRLLAQYARRRAKARGLAFDEDLSDLLPPPTHCPALGIPLCYESGRGWRDSSPSIDRIDNCKGYVKGNRVVVSDLANKIKTSATHDQIRKVADFYERLAKRSAQR